MAGVITTRRFATLKELETYYSYEDALNMIEIINVNNHNESLDYKEISNKR